MNSVETGAVRGQFLVPTLIETLKPDTATPQAKAKSEK